MKKLITTVCSIMLLTVFATAQTQSQNAPVLNQNIQSQNEFSLMGSEKPLELPIERNDIIIDSTVPRSMNSQNMDFFVAEIEPQILPNPSRGLFKLRLNVNAADVQSIEVYSATGKLRLQKVPNTLNEPLDVDFDLSGESAGTYFMVIRTKNGTYSERILLY